MVCVVEHLAGQPEKCSRCSDWLRAGGSGLPTPVGAIFFGHFGPEAHPPSHLYSGDRVRRPGRCTDYPSPPNAKVEYG